MSGPYPAQKSGHRRHKHRDRGHHERGDWYAASSDTHPSSSQSGYQHAEYEEPFDANASFRGASSARESRYTSSQFIQGHGQSHYSAYAHDARAYEVTQESSSPPRYPERQSRVARPEPQRSPSPRYLSLAEEPSATLSDPSSSRKLLILDLNGTLVFRSPHASKAKTRGGFNRDHELPRLRPVHPRPYMPAFRSYLFAPQTKAWLDVMIWSSAQPHSVSSMVDRCFGHWKNELLAIWARDTLGLTEDNYRRKVQTVKDLSKPWQNTPQAHSALTTILLDDSPLKAVLQPYNHICIGEYSAERRAQDLASLEQEREWELFVAARAQVKADESGDRVELNSRKRQRKSKRQKKLETLAHDAGVTEPEHQYDETLLAVVGVLDAVKQQRNVAAWIRSGGLWHPTVEPVPAITNVRDAVSGPSEGVLEDAGDVVANPGNDAVTTVETSVPELNPPSHVKDASVTTIPSDSMWFEDVKTVAYWAERGRRALEGLGIPVEHGIDR
ncbi:hypothetical protein IEO21_05200 [Rhodonia placenta]|uniref:Mitochondrial import inner membrane translocase subunit TIM50 n=1 Tax=Rhodonia placenta TaxID=104341 RepID=A0A8H7U2I1_9APHY|nr:hypothetical protein IEO21_05200 [Postia placenta]